MNDPAVHKNNQFDTEREQADEALRRYELLASHSRDIILFMRLQDGRILEANAAAVAAYGYSYDELLARTIHDLRAPQTREVTAGQMAKANLEGILFETVHQRKDGSAFPVEVSSRGASIGGQPTLVSVIRDISERKAVEEERNSLARFPGENPFPVIRIDAGGAFLYTNPASQELLVAWGCAGGGFAPHNVREIVQRSLETGVIQRTELLVGDKSFAFTFAPILEKRYVNMYGVDITERKRAETALRESEARYRSLFETMQEALFVTEVITDEQGNPVDWRYVDVNPQTERYMGMSYEQLVGHTYCEVVPHPDPAWIALMGKVALTGEPTNQIIFAPTRKRWLQVSVYSPRPGQAVGLFHDVTERKQAEEALRESEARLRDYAEKLERSNQDLQEFAFVASHDLQEPLRKITSFGRILLTTSENLDERQRDYLERMRAASERMQKMIEDLLALSRVSTQGRPFERVDLSQVAKEILTDLELQLQRTDGKVELEALPVVNADPFQMRQLFQNLIGNALKYHKPGAAPVVKVSSQSVSAAQVQIRIEDNGIGFEQKHAEWIFQPFQRLVSRSQYEGTGIGLTICKKIVERHGGEITAAGLPGEGAAFIVTLPKTG